jgi:hypothetical protein
MTEIWSPFVLGHLPSVICHGIAGAVGGPIGFYGRVIAAQKIGA